MHRVLAPAGQKVVLLGNEAIVRGALEARIGFASTYPGTPASEIGDTFAEIAKKVGIYFEYSANEKVAVEAAAGAAMCGVRSLVSFKQFGFNVASDSIFPLAYYGIRAGMVIVVADDPQCWSSGQSEEDTRYFARIAHMPMLEPADPQECKDFTALAFELSEKFGIPTIVRTTTRVSHCKGVVELGQIAKGKLTGAFTKDARWNTMPPYIVSVHGELHDKLKEVGKFVERTKINFAIAGKGNFGIVTAGVAYCYVMEVLRKLRLKLPVLKLGLTWPLPRKKISDFIRRLKMVLVVEELEPIIESAVDEIAKEANPKLKIYGKNLLPAHGEYKPNDVEASICKVLGLKMRKVPERLEVLPRWPTLCPGCPHRATFWAAKVAGGPDCVFGGDIGCYILGIYRPYETQDFVISMGAVEGIAHGIKKVSRQRTIAFIGDSTFFHAGIPGLINIVYNKSSPVTIVLDNMTTAMTGHQPHPGVGVTGMGEKVREIKIEDIAKACTKNVMVIDPYNIKDSVKVISQALRLADEGRPSVIVSRRECRLLFMRRARKEGIKVPVYTINQNKCKRCGTCVYQLTCPAIHHDVEKNTYWIDSAWCWGCPVCSQICPNGAIVSK